MFDSESLISDRGDEQTTHPREWTALALVVLRKEATLSVGGGDRRGLIRSLKLGDLSAPLIALAKDVERAAFDLAES